MVVEPDPESALFSTVFGVDEPDEARWFDPVLVRDNGLFVDPFLLDYAGEPEFDGAAAELFEHFREPFRLLAANPNARVSDMLAFPEMPETCLGYAENSTIGAGSGAHFAAQMREAMLLAIRAGLESPRHFEEIGLLAKGLGPDRISDITTRVLATRFVAYTERVARDLDLPVARERLWGYGQAADGTIARIPVFGNLPKNPHSRRPILLVPKAILRTLPTINSFGFADYLWGVYNEDLRRDFNLRVKDDLWPLLMMLATQNVEWVREYVDWEEARGPRPYPFGNDPEGFGRVARFWYEAGRGTPPPPGLTPTTVADVMAFIRFLNRHFKDGIERNRGYETLYHDVACTRPRNEKMAQRVYGLMARGLCEVSGVKMAPETNAGSGPVDFLFTSGYSATVLVELKLIKNTKFWDGPGAQLPTYLAEHDTDTGVFVAIGFNEKEVTSDRYAGLRDYVARVSTESGLTMEAETVDARPQKTSASRRRATTRHP